jgi:LAO/AO transport system kinase
VSRAPTPRALADAVAAGDRRSIARLISLVENDHPDGATALGLLHGRTGKAHVIGITGSPGTGKSTLTDRLIEVARRQGKTVGVVAVDPSSPFTGGAILGDRIRMQSRSTDPAVFIRSMGTRGALGGLSSHTADAVKVLEAAGKELVLVETVGVGQAEVDIIQLADTVVVVLVPNLGDDVQAVKAGLMEIADLFVVNKCDLVGADKVAAEVEANLMLAHPATPPGGGEPWSPPILRAVAERGEGVAAILEAAGRHRAWAEASGAQKARRERRANRQVRALLERRAALVAFEPDGAPRKAWAALLADVAAGKVTPQDAADRIAAPR